MSLGVAIASEAFAARLASAKAAGLAEAPAYLLAARQTLAVGPSSAPSRWPAPWPARG
jgi:hypothetical protein